MQNISLGWTTTLDLVQQQQQYTLNVSRGQKRPHTEIDATIEDIIPLHNQGPAFGTNRIDHGESAKQFVDAHILASEIIDIDNGGQECRIDAAAKHSNAPMLGPSQNPLLSLSHPRYGLSPALVANFNALGINSIYPWQSSCLLGRGILTDQRNLVYTAPTGGGKSLVADVLMLKRIIDDPSKKAILVLPYVALVQEKLKWLRKVVEGVQKHHDECSETSVAIPLWQRKHTSSIRVAGFFGGSKMRVTWSDTDIAVCTIEKVPPSLTLAKLCLLTLQRQTRLSILPSKRATLTPLV